MWMKGDPLKTDETSQALVIQESKNYLSLPDDPFEHETIDFLNHFTKAKKCEKKNTNP